MNNYSTLIFVVGWMTKLLIFSKQAQKLGVCGSNFSAKAHIKLWKACVIEKDFNKGEKIWDAMKPLMINLEQGGKFIQSIKYGVDLKGY